MSSNRSVINMAAILAILLFGDSLLYLILPLYAEELGIPLLAVGVLLSINRWVRLLSNPLAAWTYARFGLKRPVLGITVAAVLSTAMYAYPLGLVSFLAARLLWGICWSHLRLASYFVVLHTARPMLGLAMGITHAITRLGSAFTVLVGGVLIDLWGYQRGMTTMAMASALAIPLAMTLKEIPKGVLGSTRTVTKREDTPPKNMRPLPRNLCFLAAFVTSFVSSGLVASSLSLILEQRLDGTVVWGLGAATISGSVFFLRWTSNFVLSPITGRLSDRFGRRSSFLTLEVVQFFSLTTFALLTNPFITLIVAAILFLSGNCLQVVLEAAIGEVAQTNQGRIMSSFESFWDFGSASGPLVGYALAASLGFSAVYLLAASAVLFTLASYFTNVFEQKEAGEPATDRLPR